MCRTVIKICVPIRGAHTIIIYRLYIYTHTYHRANENIKHTVRIYALQLYLYNIRSYYAHPRRRPPRVVRDLRRLLPDNRILCSWSGTDCRSGEYTGYNVRSRVYTWYKAREWYCCRYIYVYISTGISHRCVMCIYICIDE